MAQISEMVVRRTVERRVGLMSELQHSRSSGTFWKALLVEGQMGQSRK